MLPTSPIVFCDSMSAGQLTKHPVFHVRTKDVEIDFHFVKERVCCRRVRNANTPTQEKMADIMTNSLPGHKFVELRTKLIVLRRL